MRTPAFLEMDPDRRRTLASSMVRVCQTAADLVQEEWINDEAARSALGEYASVAPDHGNMESRALSTTAAITDDSTTESPPSGGPTSQGLATVGASPAAVSVAQSVPFRAAAAGQIAGVTDRILNAVSFPRFVTDLINGVFKAITDSTMQQMDNFVELLNNVSASTEGFADMNMGPSRARQWIAERFPGSFEVSGGGGEPEGFEGFDDFGDDGSSDAGTLRLIPGASFPSDEALRVAFGLDPNEPVPSGDPERVLLPLARRQLAQQRQQMLATLIQMGMQRIVIDSGRIHAAMRFHIDTRSAASEEQGSTFDFRNQISAAGSFGVGPWGASASMTNTIGYVSTQQSQSTEEMNVDLDLNSEVEVLFHTDYLPLNRLATPGQAAAIRANSRNPAAEAAAAETARAARRTAAESAAASRRTAVGGRIAPPSSTPAPVSADDALRSAERARQEAGRREDADNTGATTPGTTAPGGASTPGTTPAPGGATTPGSTTPPAGGGATPGTTPAPGGATAPGGTPPPS